MAIDPPFTDWRPLTGEVSGSLRLVAAGTAIGLYGATTTAAAPDAGSQVNAFALVLTPQAIVGDPPPAVTIPQALPGGGAFDIVLEAGGELAVAVEYFGGALNMLQVGTVSGGKVAADTVYSDINDYRFPRFVRGSAVSAGHVVTAIVNGSAIALMLGKPGTTSSLPYAVASPGTAGVLIASGAPPTNGTTNGVIPTSATLALFGLAPGPPGPLSPARESPGTLFATVPRPGGKPGSPQLLSDKDGAYAFDADEQGGTVLIVAATAKGPQLIAYDLASAAAKPVAWPAGYPSTGTWIASPTVLAVAGAPGQKLVSFAFYEGTGTEASGIRYGQIDLAQVP